MSGSHETEDRKDSPFATLHMQVSESIQREPTSLLVEGVPRSLRADWTPHKENPESRVIKGCSGGLRQILLTIPPCALHRVLSASVSLKSLTRLGVVSDATQLRCL